MGHHYVCTLLHPVITMLLMLSFVTNQANAHQTNKQTLDNSAEMTSHVERWNYLVCWVMKESSGWAVFQLGVYMPACLIVFCDYYRHCVWLCVWSLQGVQAVTQFEKILTFGWGTWSLIALQWDHVISGVCQRNNWLIIYSSAFQEFSYPLCFFLFCDITMSVFGFHAIDQLRH